MAKIITTSEFIKRAESIHGDKYDYSLVDYKNLRIKVKIICRKHNVFEQAPDSHFSGSGCKQCANEKQSKDKAKSIPNFIEDAKKVHSCSYDYSLIKYYTNAHTKVKIIYKKHGIFEQTPHNHLIGSGCSRCGLITGSIKSLSSKFEKFEKLTLYLIELEFNNGHISIKNGITSRSIEDRYKLDINNGIIKNINILGSTKLLTKDTIIKEAFFNINERLEKYKDNQVPNYFAGKTECFKIKHKDKLVELWYNIININSTKLMKNLV